jgi:acyl-[acyl-carrier-protein]-phospholipid O-acyltransferase / long-chain-fatty-acid--[acyl-carrier-protein] ligase
MSTDEMCATRSGQGSSTGFGWFNATQFLGAFNDNVFKLLAIFFLIALRGEDQAARSGATANAVFVLPFLLFSAAAGALADRLAKSRIVVGAKAAELAVMLLAVLAFATGSQAGLLCTLFLMAAQSAIFAPAKYGIIPELVARERLSRANGLLQAFTYLAIIFGTATAPMLSQLTDGNYVGAALFCVLIAAIGLAVSLKIPATAPSGGTVRPSLFFLRDIWRSMHTIRGDSYLVAAVLGSAWFLLLGAYLQLNLIPYAIHHLQLSKEAGGYLFLVTALGIGAGSLLAARLSGRNVELGVVPLGALALMLACLGLGRLPGSLAGVCGWLFVAGLGAGLFIVPVDAWIQFRCPRATLGATLAASGFLGWTGVLLASGLVYVVEHVLQLDPAGGFVVAGMLTAILTLGALILLPDFLLRFIGVLVTRGLYRLRILGAEHVPLEGPALLVANHVSWVDALLLLATQQRRIRFLMDADIYATPILNALFRLMNMIPVSSRAGPKRIRESLGAARAALDEGYLVCIFAEGALTRTGMMHSFKSGVEHILRDTNYPVIPVYLGGAWGSIFSWYRGRLVSRWPTAIPYPITILFGSPLPATVSSAELRMAVLELSCRYFEDGKTRRKSLGEELVRTVRENWRRPAVADSAGTRLTYGRMLTGALAMRAPIAARAGDSEMVGVLIPPSVGGALANLAIVLLGRAPVNLNYTASAESLQSAIRQCDLRCIVTSRRFLEKVKLALPEERLLYLEDVHAGLAPRAKLLALLAARFTPARLLGRPHGFHADRLATVIFSSGSTAEPKGVMLSHHNILSNIEALRMVFQPRPADCVCGILPFFHSFGFTATLWFPLVSGFAAVYHVNPLDAGRVAELVRTHRATLLFATPTFLSAYLRKATPEDFASLRQVLAGAEKLREALAQAFREKFDIALLEGYGATELAPVATLNVPDAAGGGVHQTGHKPGSVGHPLPGVAIRIVDPDSGAPRPYGEAGLMLVKGPNVMLGPLIRG